MLRKRVDAGEIRAFRWLLSTPTLKLPGGSVDASGGGRRDFTSSVVAVTMAASSATGSLATIAALRPCRARTGSKPQRDVQHHEPRRCPVPVRRGEEGGQGKTRAVES